MRGIILYVGVIDINNNIFLLRSVTDSGTYLQVERCSSSREIPVPCIALCVCVCVCFHPVYNCECVHLFLHLGWYFVLF